MVHTAPEGPDRPTDVVRDLPDREPPNEVLLFTGSGEPVEWDALVRAAGAAEIVLLGEIHNDGVGHRARHALVAASLDGGPPAAISLEMFETDVQPVLDEYLAGHITEDHFLRASRPWDNYDPDYRPYVELARAEGIPVIAANPPRRYVNRVSRLGPDALLALPPAARQWLPPLPYPGPSDAYRAEWEALMEGAGPHGHAGPGGAEGMENMLQSQALWDAGMAWSIVQALAGDEVARVLHVAGAFHVANGTGIPELLEHYRPGSSVLLVVGYPLEPGEGFDPERHGGRADFILLSPTR